MRVAFCLTLCAVLVGCGGSARSGGVSTGAPAGDDDAGDDAGKVHSPGETRGATPIWPSADAEVEVPYGAGDTNYDLQLKAGLSELDLQLDVDTTASISQEIDALQRELRTNVISTLVSRVPQVSFGVSSFADFPVAPFGVGRPPTGDRPFRLLTPITSDIARVTSAVAMLDQPLDRGGDDPEAGAEALYQVATGVGYANASITYIEPWRGPAAVGGGTLGGVGFRPLALKVVMHVTDVRAHTPAEYETGGLTGTHSMDQASIALQKLGARLIGIMSTACTDDACRAGDPYLGLRAELSRIAWQTLATIDPTNGKCPMGIKGGALPTFEGTCPLVFDVRDDGTGLASTASDAVIGLLDQLQFSEVHALVADDPLGFIQSIEVHPLTQARGVIAPKTADRLPSGAHDGKPDTYVDVHTGARLGFRITLRNNQLAPRDVAQRFRVAVRVLGDGVVLEERTLRIVVPAGTWKPPPPDAGSPAGGSDAATADAASGNDAGE